MPFIKTQKSLITKIQAPTLPIIERSQKLINLITEQKFDTADMMIKEMSKSEIKATIIAAIKNDLINIARIIMNVMTADEEQAVDIELSLINISKNNPEMALITAVENNLFNTVRIIMGNMSLEETVTTYSSTSKINQDEPQLDYPFLLEDERIGNEGIQTHSYNDTEVRSGFSNETEQVTTTITSVLNMPNEPLAGARSIARDYAVAELDMTGIRSALDVPHKPLAEVEARSRSWDYTVDAQGMTGIRSALDVPHKPLAEAHSRSWEHLDKEHVIPDVDRKYINLTLEEVIYINQRIIGVGQHSTIMNMGNLARASDTTEDAYNLTIGEKAFIIASTIARGHAFQDGNKRTAVNCVKSFLEKNNLVIEDLNKLMEAVDLTVWYESDDMFKLQGHFLVMLNQSCPLIMIPEDYIDVGTLTPPISQTSLPVPSEDPIIHHIHHTEFTDEYIAKALAGELNFEDLENS